jgi:O-antigen/teichoic acid export membrane protein
LIVARKYAITDFSSYVISNNIYGLMLSFSAMGLGQWFIRSMIQSEEKSIIEKFFKIQVILGITFYFLNIIITLTLYDDKIIRTLSLIMGVNIIFDNIIYVIKYINIKNYEQNKSFVINITDAVLKFILALLVLTVDISIELLAVLIISIRFITLNLFIKYGTSNKINIKVILKQQIGVKEIVSLVVGNYSFVIIGSISVLFWGLGGIFVSKFLTIVDVGNYEVSFKIFSMAEIIPVIVSSSIYPMLVKLNNDNKESKITLYKNTAIAYSIYGLMSYTFILSYGSTIIPFLFGDKYINTHLVCQDMFLTMIVFPTGLLQANMLISMNQEKIDMRLNVVSLISHIILSVIGLKLIGNIKVINYSILISFTLFHILQNLYLISKNIINTKYVITNYLIIISIIGIYYYLNTSFKSNLLFLYFWTITIMITALFLKYANKDNQVYKLNGYLKIKL